MVVGPVMDLLAARRAGASVTCVLAHNNRLVSTRLDMRTRVAFWLTNVPYWMLAAHLLEVPTPLASGHVGLGQAHALAAACVALASTSFHGSVLFGSGKRAYGAIELSTVLLVADVLAANGYALTLAWCAV